MGSDINMGMDTMYDAEQEGVSANQELSVPDTEHSELELQELEIDIDFDPPDETEQAGGVALATWLFYLIATIAALGTSVYAFLEPSDSTVDDVSEEWWDAMPLQTKILSIATAVDTQIVYTVFFSFFVESAFWQLKESLSHCFHGMKDFAINAATIFFAGYAALANAAIIYAGFLWLPLGQLTAIFPSLFNYTVVFASRYVGLGHLMNRVLGFFSNDVRLQEEVIYCLEHIKPEYLDDINSILEAKTCDEAGLLDILDILSTREHAITPIDSLWYLKKGLGTVFDLGFSLSIFVTSFMLFAQKGYDGVELMTHDGFKDANPWVKIALGIVPGVVSAIFMALNAFDLRRVMLVFSKHLRHHPRDISLAVLALLMNILTAFSSWRNVAGSTITSNNIFSLTEKNSALGQAYMYINSVGSCVVTFKPMCLKLMEARAPVTRLDGMIDWAKKNRLSPAAASQLRRYSLFGGQPEHSSQRQLSLMSELEVIDSPTHEDSLAL